MQLDRSAAADVADLLGMSFEDVRKAAAGLKDDGEIEPRRNAPPPPPPPVTPPPVAPAETDDYADLVETGEYREIMGDR